MKLSVSFVCNYIDYLSSNHTPPKFSSYSEIEVENMLDLLWVIFWDAVLVNSPTAHMESRVLRQAWSY
jgi:hypothetical protein